MGFEVEGCEDVEWIQLAQDGSQYQHLVLTILNIRAAKQAAKYFTNGYHLLKELSPSQTVLLLSVVQL
jgi:hypothetical protein